MGAHDLARAGLVKDDSPASIQMEIKARLVVIERKIDSLVLEGIRGFSDPDDAASDPNVSFDPIVPRAPSPWLVRPGPKPRARRPEAKLKEVHTNQAWSRPPVPSWTTADTSLPGSCAQEDLQDVQTRGESAEEPEPPWPRHLSLPSLETDTADDGGTERSTAWQDSIVDTVRGGHAAEAPQARRQRWRPPAEARKEEQHRRLSLLSRRSLSGDSDENVQGGRLGSYFRPSTATDEDRRSRLLKTLSGKLGLEAEEQKKTWLWEVVHGLHFHLLCTAVIVSNVIYVGVSADFQLKAQIRGERDNSLWDHVEYIFCSFFTLELLLKLAVDGKFFVAGPDWKWNLFESVLVALATADMIMQMVNNIGEGIPNTAVARILRFARFIRVVRIARALRVFHSLRIVVYAIFESMLSLIWCFLVVCLIIYIFAIVFLYGVTEHFRNPSGVSLEDQNLLLTLYGSVPRAMTTLFMTISGGIDWSIAADPLISVSWLYEPVFDFYVFFMVIGVLNVVVGAFVAATADISSRDREYLVKNEMGQLQTYMSKVHTFFKEADRDKSGCLSWAEFKEYLNNPKVSAYFRALELDVSQAHRIFNLLDHDDSGQITMEEFLQGCMRLKGPAKSLDVNMLLYENKRMHSDLLGFFSIVIGKMEAACGKDAKEELSSSGSDGPPALRPANLWKP